MCAQLPTMLSGACDYSSIAQARHELTWLALPVFTNVLSSCCQSSVVGAILLSLDSAFSGLVFGIIRSSSISLILSNGMFWCCETLFTSEAAQEHCTQ